MISLRSLHFLFVNSQFVPAFLEVSHIIERSKEIKPSFFRIQTYPSASVCVMEGVGGDRDKSVHPLDTQVQYCMQGGTHLLRAQPLVPLQ